MACISGNCCGENETKEWPCEHIEQNRDGTWRNTLWCPCSSLPDDTIFCMFCGAKRPKEKDGLRELFEGYTKPYYLSVLTHSVREWIKEGLPNPFLSGNLFSDSATYQRGYNDCLDIIKRKMGV